MQNRGHIRQKFRLGSAAFIALVFVSGCIGEDVKPTSNDVSSVGVAKRMANGDFSTGKTPATPGQQPWMVALVDANEPDAQDGHFCGGSLIARQWVLTAAHCLEDMQQTENTDVVVGRYQLSTNAGERISAQAVFLHEGYSSEDDGENNDIALIKLSKAATVGSTVNLISPTTAYADDPGNIGRVTGWGLLSENGKSSPDRLHGVNLPIVDMAQCRAVDDEDVLLRDDFCAGVITGGKDSCSGDSGGPLIVRDRRGTPTQVGLVSFGLGECGQPNSFDVYIRVIEYRQWINDAKAGRVPQTDLSDFN